MLAKAKNALEYIALLFDCQHNKEDIMLLGDKYQWCSRCGAVCRTLNGEQFSAWDRPGQLGREKE
jgi:hypothetical protein